MTAMDFPPNSWSTLVVPVPEAEPLVHDYRRQFDRSAAHGMPAHITLLYPYVLPGCIDGVILNRLGRIFAAAEPFSFTLGHVAWFGDSVLYLAPEPVGPFIHLTQQLVDEFDILPYRGAHEGIHPHLTVAQTDLKTMHAIAHDVDVGLPIGAEAHDAWLMTREGEEDWKLHKTFLLGS